MYFSERYEPQGVVRLESASVTMGLRDAQPWLHCHGIWHDADGQRLGGHVLPNDAVISEPIDASVWFLDGGILRSRSQSGNRLHTVRAGGGSRCLKTEERLLRNVGTAKRRLVYRPRGRVQSARGR